VREAQVTNVLLFDIVNVQNWPAALRSARSCSPCCKVASISERRRWPFLCFQYSVIGDPMRVSDHWLLAADECWTENGWRSRLELL